MSTPGHKPASNPFASYAYHYQHDDEEIEDEEEPEWSDEEDEEDLYNDDEFDDDFDDDYDSDTEEGDHEYLEDEEDVHVSHDYRSNNYAAGPDSCYFYPEQPYIGLPTVPKPSSKDSTSKLRYYVFSPICDIAMIYIKFAILAILIYACALWYTVYYGDMNSILTDMDEDDDVDTCPANLST